MGDFDLMIKTFDEGLAAKEWILGEQFSAADVMLGSSAVFPQDFDAPDCGLHRKATSRQR